VIATHTQKKQNDSYQQQRNLARPLWPMLGALGIGMRNLGKI
jgi:hypothetical protein